MAGIGLPDWEWRAYPSLRDSRRKEGKMSRSELGPDFSSTSKHSQHSHASHKSGQYGFDWEAWDSWSGPLPKSERLTRDTIVVTGHFFGKIFNESLGIQLGRPLFLDASTADAKRSRLLKFLS